MKVKCVDFVESNVEVRFEIQDSYLDTYSNLELYL